MRSPVLAQLPNDRGLSIWRDGGGDPIPAGEGANGLEFHAFDLRWLELLVIFVSLQGEDTGFLPPDRLGVFVADDCAFEFGIALANFGASSVSDVNFSASILNRPAEFVHRKGAYDIGDSAPTAAATVQLDLP